MTETADIPRNEPGGTPLPEALEDQLFEVWLQDDRSAAVTGLEQLCSLHADQAAALRQLAKKLDRADSTLGFDEELQPDHIDRYEILRCIGRGGFGVVWLARQIDPHRHVAIKVLTSDTRSRTALKRFELERDTLAALQHESIAKIIEAGTTKEGRPFFVMEYVDGHTITQFCDEKRLTIEERLELFLQVCAAVEYAHQNSVIHRDLKPPNILVRDGQRPVVKIIDFGLAKAMQDTTSSDSGLTEDGRFVGTPEYMSPEQASGDRVDTRSDVYSLGVVLFELLCGALPIPAATLRRGGWKTAMRVLEERAPLRLTTAFHNNEKREVVAQLRRCDPGNLERRLRRDLEWIVATALAKDRSERYSSIADLAKDVRRHLENRPLSVGRPSIMHAARKFVRRHKVGVALGIAAAALSAFAVWEIIRARDDAIARRTEAEANEYAAHLTAAQSALATRRALPLRRALDKAREEYRDWEWGYLDSESKLSELQVRSPAATTMTRCLARLGNARVVTAHHEPVRTRIAVTDLTTGASQGLIELERDAEVFDLQATEDGGTIAVALAHPAELRLFDAKSGRPALWQDGGRAAPATVRFETTHAVVAISTRHNVIAAAAGDAIYVYELDTGRRLHANAMIREGHSVQDLEFSPDGRFLVACGQADGISVWDWRTASLASFLSTGLAARRHIAISPDSRFVACACFEAKQLRVFDIDLGELAFTLHSDRSVFCSLFLDDGKRIVTAHRDGSIAFWDIATRSVTETLPGHLHYVDRIVDLNRDAGFATVSADGEIRTWRSTSPRVGCKPSFSMQGKALCFAADRHAARGYSVLADVPRGLERTATQLSFRLIGLRLDRDERCFDRTLDVADGDLPLRLDIDASQCAVVIAFRSGRLSVFDAQSGEPLGSMASDLAPSAMVARGGLVLVVQAGDEELRARIVDVKSSTVLWATVRKSTASAGSGELIVHGDSVRVVLAHERLEIIDLRSRTALVDIPLTSPAVLVRASDDGTKIAVADLRGGITEYDSLGRMHRVLRGHERRSKVSCMSYTPNGRRLACFDGANHSVRIFDTELGSQLLELYDHSGWARTLTFDAEGARLFALIDSGPLAWGVYDWRAAGR